MSKATGHPQRAGDDRESDGQVVSPIDVLSGQVVGPEEIVHGLHERFFDLKCVCSLSLD